MLDRVGAGRDRAPHPFRGRGVNGDLAARVMRRLDRSLQFGEREGRAALLAAAPAIVAIKLDEVRPARDLVADRANDLIDTARLLRALRDRNPRLEPLGAVGAARDDRLSRDEKMRSGDDPLIDGLPQPDIGEARPLGTEVAQGGEAGL